MQSDVHTLLFFSFFFADTGQLTGCRSSTNLRLKAWRELSKGRHLFWGCSILTSYDKEDRKRQGKKKNHPKRKDNPKTWQGEKGSVRLFKEDCLPCSLFLSFFFDSPQAAHRIIAAGIIIDHFFFLSSLRHRSRRPAFKCPTQCRCRGFHPISAA